MQLTRLGPYEIGRPLGKGGMGSVFEATDLTTGQRVAVKALTPHLAMAEGFRERFEAEIESLKSLRHEGIVRLYGYGEQDGVLFYSMELVEGVSLEDELKAGRRFNWREVTNIAIQLSLALKHAHDHGIVHRDIKPANILLYDEDKVKLADFGIARLFGNNQLTTAGGVLGTADYMSPEQADGRPVTARCDQYSLGGVMYALLAGRPPFRAKNLPQMLQLQRFAQPEPVRRYAADAPEQLERLIAQLLAKEPVDRFPNMQVLARHLQAMVKALSRPTADDFALVSDDPNADPADANWEHSISIELTQLEVVPPESRLGASTAGGDSKASNGAARVVKPQDAATLAADELPRAAGQVTVEPSATTPLIKSSASAAPRLPERPSHFTTVEEEEARRKAQAQRSWLPVVAQLLALAAVLAGMCGVAFYLTRPRTADELYHAVAARAGLENPDSLTAVDGEIEEFLDRFAADPRAAELERFQESIVLDKLERRLQRPARGGNSDPPLLPLEQLYLRALELSHNSPDDAAEVLQSIVDLHPEGAPVTNGDSTEKNAAGISNSPGDDDLRTTAVVQLAQRRLATLRAEVAAQSAKHRKALDERLAAAQRLSATEPKQAVAMYRAMISLYEDSNWASDAIAEAKRQLKEIEK